MSNQNTVIEGTRAYAGPTAGPLVEMLTPVTTSEPLALWVYTRPEVTAQMAGRSLTDEEWQRVVEAFDDICGTDGGLFDQLYEALGEAAQSVVPVPLEGQPDCT